MYFNTNNPAAVFLAVLLLLASTVVDVKGSDRLIRVTGIQSVRGEEVRRWIEPQLEYVETSGVSMAAADDAAYFLETALRQRGYANARVDWKLESNQEGAQRILLQVHEGAGTKLGNIQVHGNSSVNDDGIIELLTSRTGKRVGESGAVANLPYVPEDLAKGEKRIREFYMLLGYPEVEVQVDTIHQSGVANVEVTIDEGRRYHVGEVVLPDAPNTKLEEEFLSIQEEYTGKSFTITVPDSLSSRLASLARDAGYYDADVYVDPIVIPENSNGDSVYVELAVSAEWGESVPVTEIRVSGNRKVRSEFFDRHFSELSGKPYSPDTTNREVEELLKTGAFETVRTDIERLDDNSIALHVSVEEASTKQLAVYGGFATYEGPVAGFEFQHLNLNGSLRKIDAEIEASRRGLRGEINYEDPWFAWSEYRLHSGLFALNRINEGYSKFETGGRYEFSRKLGKEKRTHLAFFGQATYTEVYDSDIAPAALGDPSYFANIAGISLSFDRTDNPLKPRSGFIAQSALGFASGAIGSEIEFLRATGRLGYYLPIGAATMRLSARAGIISPFGDTTSLPIDLRFYNGGAQSVRSFQERELGPLDGRGNPIGGGFYSIFNFELELPVFCVDGLSIVPFADAGNLLFDSDDAGLSDMRYALGLGLRYNTPLGPIRVEYGYNPDRRPGEAAGAVHAGLGVAY